MAKIALAPYAIRVYDRTFGENRRLNAFDGTNALGTFLEEFFTEYGLPEDEQLPINAYRDEAEQVSFVVEGLAHDPERGIVAGLMWSGPFGAEFRVMNLRQRAITAAGTADDAVLRPAYFRFHLPPGHNRGILLVQWDGASSIYTLLSNAVRRAFGQRHNDHVLRFAPQVPEAYLERFLREAVVKSYTIRTYTIPEGAANILGYDGAREDFREADIVIKPRRNVRFRLPAWLGGDATVDTPIGELAPPLEGFGEDATMAIEMQLDDVTRTFHVGSNHSVSNRIDITADVARDEHGHPVLADIEMQAEAIAQGLLRQIGVIVNQ